jgi:hypothetical protein
MEKTQFVRYAPTKTKTMHQCINITILHSVTFSHMQIALVSMILYSALGISLPSKQQLRHIGGNIKMFTSEIVLC